MTRHFEIVCQVCARPTSNDRAMRCAACGGTLGFRYAAPDRWPAGTTRVWDHAALLPIARDVAPVTLGEGGTPLIAARGDQGCRLHWKIEGANPTGSQKDRALALALTHARATGARRVVVASTGSVGLACAAYGARAGIPCLVLLPDGTPTERVRPMLAFGATVAAVQSTFETIERLLQTLDASWYQASTIAATNPYQAEGPKTIAYEIVGQLGHAPDWVVVPVGGGGTLAGIARGFAELHRFGRIARVPRLASIQSAIFNALEIAMARGLATAAELAAIAADECHETIARNLKHGVPPDALAALAALRASDGAAISVADDAVRDWHARLAAREGIFCEPSSAAAAAGVAKLVATGRIATGDSVVAIITGSGLREPSALPARDPVPLPASAAAPDLDRLVPIG